MQSFNEEGQDVFFDSYDYIRTSTSSASSGDSVVEHQESEFRNSEYEFWTRELISVGERRARFLQGMGLDEFGPPHSAGSQESEEARSDMTAEKLELERITETSGAVLDSLSPDNGGHRDSDCCIRDLDSGKRFIVQSLGQDGLLSMLKEVGSDRLMTLQEFESSLGLSHSVQRFMRSVVTPSGEEHHKGLDAQKKKSRSWWRSFMAKMHGIGMCKDDVSVKNSRLPRTTRTRVQQHRKRCLEFSALYMGQEIQAHKGLIRAMGFSPSGWYLASGGEDCVVRIWQVIEVEASCKCFTTDAPSNFIDKIRDKNLMLGSKVRAPIVIPKKVFKIEETPLQELCGHTSDVLGLSWSNTDCLLTSSKDKTVRLWKVGFNGCLKVFQHNDYVTCIQFNPVDNRYFISGSIDGKVRIWGVSENRVVDWADLRDIVTAVSYRPDGKGFVVGSITGNCRFYDYSDCNMQLGTHLCIQGRKKSPGKRITGLQYSPENCERVMITSADSKVRIFDGADVIRKFRGLRKTKSHLSASFTSDGRYIVSVGEDSHVYIWNHNTSSSPSSKGVKSTRSCERFFSEGVSVAVPWPGMDRSGSGSSNNNLRAPSQPLKILEPSTWLKDLDRCYLGALFLVDGLSRVSATWPEEGLVRSPQHSSRVDNHPQPNRRQDHRFPSLTSLSATWSLVIVTASSDGSIRTFHNYGLPVRL